jgi:hypothetical protein
MELNMVNENNRYTRIIEAIFEENYFEGIQEIAFKRDDLVVMAKKLGIKIPKNLGDIIYSFRYRVNLPASISQRAPAGLEWVIRAAGQGKYKFSLASTPRIIQNHLLAETKIPDATPGIIAQYAINDEQGLLARIRYNRLIDIFTGVSCYSLQNHLRTTVPNMGQVETDEVYVGVDQWGAQYVFPVQAKGGADQIGIIQIEQDFALCAVKFPILLCRPIAAQLIEDHLIALFSFEVGENGIAISDEKHYRLTTPEQITEEDLTRYRHRTPGLFLKSERTG